MPGSASSRQLQFTILLVVASCVLSALAILGDPVINDDGVFYLVIAGEIANNGIGAGFALFDRPFYPLLIATLHRLSGLSLLLSAHLINAALLALLVVSFSRLAARLGKDPALAFWGALLILLLPQLNEYRSSILRDFGYWALLLSSFLPLQRYQLSQRWQDGLCWAALCIAAAAFRPEALLFALLLPLASVQGETRALALMSGARLYACIGALVLPPLLVLARFDSLQAPMSAVMDIAMGMLHAIPSGFEDAVTRYAGGVLDPRASDQAAFSLLLGLLGVLALKWLTALGPVYVALLGWGMLRRQIALPQPSRLLFRGMLLCCLLLAVGFVLSQQFLTGRYLLLLCIVALLPATLALRTLMLRISRSRRAALHYLLLGLLIALLGADGLLNFGTRQNYRNEAIAWMEQHLEPGAEVFSNDRILAFHSRGVFQWNEVMEADVLLREARAPLQGKQYWIIHTKQRDAAIETALQHEPARLTLLQGFSDGDRAIRILRVNPQKQP
jgi:hypothetical protein